MKKNNFPTAYTVLFILTIICAGLTWILPAGKYETTLIESIDRRVPISGTYHNVDKNPQGIIDIFKAPVAGFYDPVSYQANSIDIAIFVLFIGGFLNIVNSTGAITAGINTITKKLKNREILLIPILMTLFAIGGSTYGMAEETLAFYGILLPIVLSAGFDSITAASILIIGTGIGNIGSTINPFATILASNVAGIPFTDGIYCRLAILASTLVIGILYVMRYAKKIKENPKKSLVYELYSVHQSNFNKESTSKKLTKKQNFVLIIFSLTFIMMIYGVSSLNWSMADMSALFLFSSLVIGFLTKMGEKKFIDTFLEGAKDLLGVALVIGIARGIIIVLDNGNVTGTILNFFEQLILDSSSSVFLIGSFLTEMILSLFIPSSSGLAVISIPILAPLADIAGISQHLVITAYQSANGLVNLFNPTFAVVMGGLTMAKVPYNKWLKFVMPLFGLFFVCILLILNLSV